MTSAAFAGLYAVAKDQRSRGIFWFVCVFYAAEREGLSKRAEGPQRGQLDQVTWSGLHISIIIDSDATASPLRRPSVAATVLPRCVFDYRVPRPLMRPRPSFPSKVARSLARRRIVMSDRSLGKLVRRDITLLGHFLVVVAETASRYDHGPYR